ncbi:hypothetical protein CWI38_0009p0100 [Hamiltosporidium tvaerminnensis]|uniref:Uncharacterized protein n=1 Tax=Hamiltosporidium tvaerminnensis TaxID=1176355 RepID=A0A4Q9M2E1_9MICR|nr:hypothetical protein CWI38_0009p0100 [Hamiltosporidium tvaerminnensis]
MLFWLGEKIRYHSFNMTCYLYDLDLFYMCSIEIISYLHLKRLRIPQNRAIGVVMKAERHEELTHPLKQASNDEDDEPTNNLNEEPDLEEETVV